MTQEDKKLLIKDLATRVPYGVMVEQSLFPSPLAEKEQVLKSVQANDCVQLYWYKYINEFVPIHCIKPYLRPMSSMTEEELKEYHKTFFYHERYDNEHKTGQNCSITFETYDWLNAHHFDYRGLIKKGLALEAPEGMYK